MKKTALKKGFTLPEVLVSISVIVMVVMAATNLLVASIRSNAMNINTLVAYGLAQEGIEAVRNIRDSDWLLGANFQGQIGKQSISPWIAVLPSVIGDTRFYTVDFRDPLDMDVQTTSQLADVAPWKLEELGTEKDYGASKETSLYKKAYGSTKELRYTHESGEVTPFHRYIAITPVDYSVGAASVTSAFSRAIPKVKKMRVTSIVEWDESGSRREVRMDTELTDWKETF
jgi:prepilin-type N-terminal cleavage/methylation domain-containing protein